MELRVCVCVQHQNIHIPPPFFHHIYHSLARNNDMNEIMVPVSGGKSLRFLLDDIVADFPEGRGARGTVDVVVLVEPVAQDATAGS
jgi:hypothetical protein